MSCPPDRLAWDGNSGDARLDPRHGDGSNRAGAEHGFRSDPYHRCARSGGRQAARSTRPRAPHRPGAAPAARSCRSPAAAVLHLPGFCSQHCHVGSGASGLTREARVPAPSRIARRSRGLVRNQRAGSGRSNGPSASSSHTMTVRSGGRASWTVSQTCRGPTSS